MGWLSFVFFFFTTSVVIFSYLIFQDSDKFVAGTDFVSYVTGSLMIISGNGKEIYDEVLQNSFQNQLIFPLVTEGTLLVKVPPFVSLAFLPLTFFSLESAFKIFVVINVLLLVVGIVSLGRIFSEVKKIKFWYLVPFGYFPVVHAIILGQLSVVLLLLFLVVFKFLLDEKWFKMGVVSGLLLFKVQFVVFLPFAWLMVKNKGKFFKGLIAAIFLLISLSFMVGGLEVFWEYPRFLFETENLAHGSPVNRQFNLVSVSEAIVSNFGYGYKVALGFHSLLYILAIVGFSKNRKKMSGKKGFVVAVIFSLLFGLHIYDHDWSLLLIPMFYLIDLMVFLKGNLRNEVMLVVFVLFFLPYLFFSNTSFVAPVVLSLMGFWFFRSKLLDFDSSRSLDKVK